RFTRHIYRLARLFCPELSQVPRDVNEYCTPTPPRITKPVGRRIFGGRHTPGNPLNRVPMLRVTTHEVDTGRLSPVTGDNLRSTQARQLQGRHRFLQLRPY